MTETVERPVIQIPDNDLRHLFRRAREGGLVRTFDRLPHAEKTPSLTLTDTEKRYRLALYRGNYVRYLCGEVVDTPLLDPFDGEHCRYPGCRKPGKKLKGKNVPLQFCVGHDRQLRRRDALTPLDGFPRFWNKKVRKHFR